MLNDILYFHFSTVTTSSSSALWFRQHLVHYWKVQNISTDCFPVSMIKVFTSDFLARGNSIVFQHFFFIIILKLLSLYFFPCVLTCFFRGLSKASRQICNQVLNIYSFGAAVTTICFQSRCYRILFWILSSSLNLWIL